MQSDSEIEDSRILYWNNNKNMSSQVRTDGLNNKIENERRKCNTR